MYNLIYINTHDTGRMISPYGYNIPTDNLLSLAKDSTLFTNCYCCGPTCSPSRAAMLTGTYPVIVRFVLPKMSESFFIKVI